MDEVATSQQIIMNLLKPYEQLQYANGEIRNKAIFERESERYLIMSDGWENTGRRIHGCLIDLEIINGKIWVQRDVTEYGIACELIEAGIPKERIVLGFKEPKVRPYTGFAVA